MGEMTFGSGTTSGRPGMIVNPKGDLQEHLAKAIEAAPENIIDTERTANELRSRANDTAQRQNSVIVKDGEVYTVKGEHLVPLIDTVKWYRAGSKQATIDARRDEIEKLLEVREALRTVLDVQSRSEDGSKARKELGEAYDSFVDTYGYITESSAVKALINARDPMGYVIQQLESKAADGTYEKRPIFSRDMVRTKNARENPTVVDAFAIQRNESIVFDINRVAELAKVTPEEAAAQLLDTKSIYKIHNGQYDAADVFLSGNMARKKRLLLAAIAEGETGLEDSLKAVEELMPKPIPYTSIDVRLGATWIPATDYREFVAGLLGEEIDEIEIERFPGRWKVRIPPAIQNKSEATTLHGHPQVRFASLLGEALNNGMVKVTAEDIDGNKYVDEAATREANAKVSELREKFASWVWTDPARITRLSSTYNETFNADVTPSYDNCPLTFEGMALQRGEDEFSLRKHQESAVWRGLLTGKGIFAHEVGTGKTYTMGALAIESRRLGLANKPVLFAFNSNSATVYRDIQDAYPAAKILYVDNLSPTTRDATLASIATDEWDLVVIPHSLVGHFSLKPETLQKLLQEQLDSLEAAAHEAFDEDDSGWAGSMPADLNNVTDDDLRELRNPTAKALVKERNRLVSKIKEAQDALAKSNNVFVEDMGIDMLMVDEAHEFKKIPIGTKQRLKGLNTTGSGMGQQ